MIWIQTISVFENVFGFCFRFFFVVFLKEGKRRWRLRLGFAGNFIYLRKEKSCFEKGI